MPVDTPFTKGPWERVSPYADDASALTALRVTTLSLAVAGERLKREAERSGIDLSHGKPDHQQEQDEARALAAQWAKEQT